MASKNILVFALEFNPCLPDIGGVLQTSKLQTLGNKLGET